MNMRITNPRRITLGLTAIVFAICGTAFADTETWPFDLQTSGGNVYHASSTAVCNTSPLYDGAYEITLLEVEVSYIGITFGPFDVRIKSRRRAPAGATFTRGRRRSRSTAAPCDIPTRPNRRPSKQTSLSTWMTTVTGTFPSSILLWGPLR